MKRLLPLLLIVLTLAACTKNNDTATTNVEKEQQLSGKTWVGTTASASNQQISLAANKSFTMQLNAGVPGYNFVVNIAGNWAVEGDHIVMTNTKATVFNNGAQVVNLQAFVTSTGCNCYQTLKAALNSYSLLLQVDDSGNFSLKDSSGNAVKFYIKNLNGDSLTLTYNGITFNFTLKTS